jgi:hypothetical protein
VKAGPDHDDIYHILADSPRRRGPLIAFWELGHTLRPQLAANWDMDDAKDLVVQFYGIPIEAWTEVARVFAEHLIGSGTKSPN